MSYAQIISTPGNGNVVKRIIYAFSFLIFPVFISAIFIVMVSCGGESGRSDTPPEDDGRSLTVCAAGCDFASIQDAVDSAEDWFTISIMPGTYSGDVEICKPVFLLGANYNVSPVKGRTEEAVINGLLTVGCNDVTVKGIMLTNPEGDAGIIVDQASRVIIKNNIIGGIRTTGTGCAQGIHISGGESGVGDILIEDNIIFDIGHSGLVNDGELCTAVGVRIGIEGEAGEINDIEIRGNLISSVYAGTDTGTDGSGAYGILVRQYSANLRVINNNISDIEGLRAYAVGLECDTPDAVVTGNIISNVADHDTPSEAAGIFIRDNPSLNTLTIKSNNIDHESVLYSCVSKDIADEVYVDDDFNESKTDGRIWGINAFDSINRAIYSVKEGGVVRIAAGTYSGDVEICKPVFLLGANYNVSPVKGRTEEAVINGLLTVGCNDVTVKGIMLTNPEGDAGIIVDQASRVIIKNNIIGGIRTTGTGCAQGIHISGGESGVGDILIEDNIIFDIGHSGLVNDGELCTAVGVRIGIEGEAGEINDIEIRGNLISSVYAGTDTGTDGSGAYGILVRQYSANLRVINNNISDIEGLRAYAVGLECDTPDAAVTGNIISNVADHDTPSEAAGIFIRDNPSWSTLTIIGNSVDPENVLYPVSAKDMTNEVFVDDDYNGSETDGRIWGVNAFNSINWAIYSVKVDGVVRIAAGTYDECVNVNRRVTVSGAGSGDDGSVLMLSNKKAVVVEGKTYPVYNSPYKPVMIISASGDSENRIKIENINIKVDKSNVTGFTSPGILFRPGAAEDNYAASYSFVELDNVRVNGTEALGAAESGVFIDSVTSVSDFQVNECEFSGLAYGMLIYNRDYSDSTVVEYMEIKNSVFNNNTLRGIYAEKLSDSKFINVTVSDNGNISSSFNAGIEILLKYGQYKNLVFENLAVTGNGSGSDTGAGLAITAQNTGSYGGTKAATLQGVIVSGGIFTGNRIGIGFSVPAENNTSPTGITVSGAGITGNAVRDMDNRLSGVTVDAKGNWWGDAAGPSGAQINGDVDCSGWLQAEPAGL